MPERRVDGIVRSEAGGWSTTGLSKTAAAPLRILTGQPANLPTGEVISAMVSKAKNNGFKVTLNGETFTLKGLPPSLIGKQADFIAQHSKSGGKTNTQIFHAGVSRSARPQSATTPLPIRSPLPGGLQTGSTVTARIESVGGGLMQLRITSGAFDQQSIATTAAAGFKAGEQLSGVLQQVDGKPVLLADIVRLQSQPRITSLEIRSALPPALKPASSVTARVESVGSSVMQLRIEGGTADNHLLTTTTVAGVQTGQRLDGVVQQIDGRPVLLTRTLAGSDIQAMTQPLLSPKSAPAVHALANMSPGTTSLAIVERVLGNGYVQLSLQGNRIEAPAPPSIAAGDGLIVKVTDKPASFDVLSVQPNVIGKAHALLRQQAASNIPLSENLTAIRNLLAPLPAEDVRTIPVLSQLEGWLNSATVDHDTPLNGERLSNMIQHSGQLLEHKLLSLLHSDTSPATTLHDLKTIMLSMASGQVKISNMHHLTQLLSELGHSASSRIESTQALNVLAHAHADAMRIELPMLVNQQMVNVQLSLEQHNHSGSEGRDGQSEQAPCKVLIALEMSGLGKLRVDASISEMAVHARIHHTCHEARALMQSHLERLESRLLNLGFKEVYLLATPAQPEQRMQERFEQLEQVKPASSALLDIRI